jgi:competence protein ComEA
MPTTSERRALVLLSVVATLGIAARIGRATYARTAPTPAERHALDIQIARVESARAQQASGVRRRERRAEPQHTALTPRDSAVRVADPEAHLSPRLRSSARPTRSPIGKRDVAHTPIDVDVASANDIETLPLIGHALAARIVANRDSCGAFGSLAQFQRVRGIGPALAKRIAPHVTFSGASRPSDAARPSTCAGAEKRAALRRRGRP